jgi:hypothetical protein
VTGPVPSYVRRRRVADKLRAAADLLAADGWIQGKLEDDQGRHCMTGALNAVTGDDQDVYFAVFRVVRDYLGGLRLTWWNDEAGRTAEQVVAVLRETAAEEDALAAALEAESRPDGELP